MYKDVPSSDIISFGMGFTIQFGDVSSLHFSRSSEKTKKKTDLYADYGSMFENCC